MAVGMRMKAVQNKRGLAMIMAVAVTAVALALMASMLLAAAMLVANANRTAAQQQARIAAVTLSEAVEKELTADIVSSMSDASMGKYLYDNMSVFNSGSGWSYYSDDLGHGNLEAATRSFKMTPPAQFGEAVTADISMYWTAERSVVESTLPGITTADKYDNAELVVTVSCACDGEPFRMRCYYRIICNSGDTQGDTAKWMLDRSE